MQWIQKGPYRAATLALASSFILGGCASSPDAGGAVDMYPAEVGSKTHLYEVVSRTQLKLAPGTIVEVTDGPCGPKSGMIFRQANGATGGYMACGCHPATQGSCTTVSDNPEYPSCAGGCTNSEGRPVGCSLYGPLIGPPRTPLQVVLRER